jgi:hypothetical protein
MQTTGRQEVSFDVLTPLHFAASSKINLFS